jgi:hypothetical protein
MRRRRLEHREAALAIQAPADVLETVLHLDGETRVERASDDSVIADGPIAVQAHAIETNDEYVSRQRGLDEEWAGLWIASKHTADAFLVDSCRIYRRCVNRVAGPDVQDRRIGRRELPMKGRRHELVTLGRPATSRRHALRRPRGLEALLTFLGSDERSGHAVGGGHVSCELVDRLVAPERESDRVAHQRSIERAWANRPRQLGAVQLQRHPLMKWIAENVLGQ